MATVAPSSVGFAQQVSLTERNGAMGAKTTHTRAFKRRSTKACHSCRVRKVRCDVVIRGEVCTNCRLDSIECVVSQSGRRKRAPSTSKATSPPTRTDPIPTMIVPPLRLNAAQDIPSPVSQDNADNLPVCLTFEEDTESDQACSQREDINQYGQMQTGQTAESGPHRHLTPFFAPCSGPQSIQLAHPQNAAFSRQPLPLSPGLLTLPAYIRALPHHLQADDYAFLESKGALAIPDTVLRNEMLRAYTKYVHPFMPILDLEQFLQSIEKNDGSNPISLLLFQAVLFASVLFVDLRYLQNQGYRDRKTARDYFFSKVRLLYGLDYEREDLSLLQSLLLMTYWYQSSDDKKDTWYWLGNSLSLALTMGLHRNHHQSTRDPAINRLYKRIWWSCLVRDRLIALGMRRPMRISDDDYDVPMLEIEDFDIHPLPENLFLLLGGAPSVLNLTAQSELATTFIELAKVCLCLGHIIKTQYSTLGPPNRDANGPTMMLSPRSAPQQSQMFEQCEEQLTKWYSTMAPGACYSNGRSGASSVSDDDKVIELHRASLLMIYLTAVSVLHRPRAFGLVSYVERGSRAEKISREKVRASAVRVTQLISSLSAQDEVRYLSTSGVCIVIAAIVGHLLDIKSHDQMIKESGMHNFSTCMQVLQRLREMYYSADSAFLFLKGVIRTAKIDISTAFIPLGTNRPLRLPVSPSASVVSKSHIQNQNEQTNSPSGPILLAGGASSAPIRPSAGFSTSLPNTPDFDAVGAGLDGMPFSLHSSETGEGVRNQWAFMNDFVDFGPRSDVNMMDNDLGIAIELS